MAFDFPATPTVGTVFTSSDGKAKYFWNGSAWMMGSGVSTL